MPDTLPLAEVVHAIPGRARLRIPARRGDAVFFASVATGLSAIPGVFHAQVRPMTASIVIRHSAPLARIGEAAEKARLFALAIAATPPPSAFRIEPKAALVASLGVFALWQLTQGRVLPPALTLAWYAAGLTGLLPQSETGDGGE
jgi:hypothetical protein